MREAMFRRIALLSLLVFLAACVPQSGVLVSEEVGLSGAYGPRAPISDDPHHVLMGHVIRTTRDGETVRALVISQRIDGVHRLSFREAWANGGTTRLPYRATGSLLDGCTHGQCRDHSVGMILLSEPLFALAQTQGLTAYLVGREAHIPIYAPPRLFALPDP